MRRRWRVRGWLWIFGGDTASAHRITADVYEALRTSVLTRVHSSTTRYTKSNVLTLVPSPPISSAHSDYGFDPLGLGKEPAQLAR